MGSEMCIRDRYKYIIIIIIIMIITMIIMIMIMIIIRIRIINRLFPWNGNHKETQSNRRTDHSKIIMRYEI